LSGIFARKLDNRSCLCVSVQVHVALKHAIHCMCRTSCFGITASLYYLCGRRSLPWLDGSVCLKPIIASGAFMQLCGDICIPVTILLFSFPGAAAMDSCATQRAGCAPMAGFYARPGRFQFISRGVYLRKHVGSRATFCRNQVEDIDRNIVICPLRAACGRGQTNECDRMPGDSLHDL
jgi:hypothetical protein